MTLKTSLLFSVLATSLWACEDLAKLGVAAYRRVPISMTETVRIHDVLGDTLKLPVGLIDEHITNGYEGQRVGYSSPAVAAIRDAEPILFFTKNDSSKGVVIEHTHPSLDSPHPLGHAAYIPGSTSMPGFRPYLFDGKTFDWETRRATIFFTGSDVFPMRNSLLISERVLTDNGRPSVEWIEELERRYDYSRRDMTAYRWMRLFGEGAGRSYESKASERVLAELGTLFSVEPQRVITLKTIPANRNPRLDSLVGVLGDSLVAVSEIPTRALTADLDPQLREIALHANAVLDAQATQIKNQGLSVVRIPMDAPTNFQADPKNAWGGTADFRSPVNWVVKEGTLYIPVYPKPGSIPDYSEITTILAPTGLKFVFVDLSALQGDHGGLRTITSDWVKPR